MSNVKVSSNASGTGTLTIAAPNTNTDRTLTLPDESGTVLTTATPGVPVNGPAFSAYQSVAQTGLSSGTSSKITFTSVRFDTASCFSSSRFTPNVAGYYQINAAIAIIAAGAASNILDAYKNGSLYSRGGRIYTTAGVNVDVTYSDIVYMNGSTDYFEIYAFSNGGSWETEANQSFFSAALVRAA